MSKPVKPRHDALAKLLGEFDQNAERYMPPRVAKTGKARMRRLVNALLRERADEAASRSAVEMSHAYEAGSREQVFFFDAPRVRVRAAVLRRPTGRPRGRDGK